MKESDWHQRTESSLKCDVDIGDGDAQIPSTHLFQHLGSRIP